MTCDIDTNPRSQALMIGIIDLAHALGLTVLAKNVERQAQVAVLRSLGCDLGQGYYWSAALTRPRSGSGWISRPNRDSRDEAAGDEPGPPTLTRVTARYSLLGWQQEMPLARHGRPPSEPAGMTNYLARAREASPAKRRSTWPRRRESCPTLLL